MPCQTHSNLQTPVFCRAWTVKHTVTCKHLSFAGRELDLRALHVWWDPIWRACDGRLWQASPEHILPRLVRGEHVCADVQLLQGLRHPQVLQDQRVPRVHQHSSLRRHAWGLWAPWQCWHHVREITCTWQISSYATETALPDDYGGFCSVLFAKLSLLFHKLLTEPLLKWNNAQFFVSGSSLHLIAANLSHLGLLHCTVRIPVVWVDCS